MAKSYLVNALLFTNLKYKNFNKPPIYLYLIFESCISQNCFLNLIFAHYTGSKNQVRNRQKNQLKNQFCIDFKNQAQIDRR